ncbi:MAG: glucose-6-phosphate dehydrogenase assembly protein OpcA [Chloroflexi bacterium]|nr:glucose-6-phosphate dehydrogenase assembly protein OpcA [Chloroflexota bacterium]
MVKDNAQSVGLHLPWAGKSVRIENVEEELSHLWRMSADNVRTSHNINVRTSVLNLVICAQDVESAQRATRILRDLSSTHIARVTLLILDSSSTSSNISAWVTLRSFPIISDMMRHHFEQITIHLSGTAMYAAAQIIQPLLKPDLPVYLWWLDDLLDENTIFNRLVSTSSRVMIDSSRFFTPEQSIQTLPQLIEACPSCAFSDLNWGRITPWRELIAQFFDVVAYKPYLAGVTSVEIEHAVAPIAEPTRTEQGFVSPNPTQALLLAAWLQTRLGWKLSNEGEQDEHDPESGEHFWHMIRTGPLGTRPLGQTGRLGKIKRGNLYIRPRVQLDLQPGSICLIRMVSTIDDKNAIFTINREADSENVLTSVEMAGETRPQRTVSIAATHKESELLHDELEIMGRDHVYEQMLQEVFELLSLQ